MPVNPLHVRDLIRNRAPSCGGHFEVTLYINHSMITLNFCSYVYEKGDCATLKAIVLNMVWNISWVCTKLFSCVKVLNQHKDMFSYHKMAIMTSVFNCLHILSCFPKPQGMVVQIEWSPHVFVSDMMKIQYISFQVRYHSCIDAIGKAGPIEEVMLCA